MDKLPAFVKEQIASGVSPAELKTHLISNGWKEQDVDAAIRSAQGATTKNRVFIGLAAVFLVGILVLILVSFAKNNEQPVPANNHPAPDNQQISLQTQNSCSSIDSSIEKDACYKNILKTGFDCETLSDLVEKTYCQRAYEDITIQGVERVDEEI